MAVRSNQAGFSLVELSIVLVILGLLTGGILTGQSLIRAAELRSITTDFQRFQTAIQTFRDKYFALPGDMRNATDFWSAAHATPTTCRTTEGTGTQTCNGSGNGIVGGGTEHWERFAAWEHLSNAGLIEGTYTGVQGPSSTIDSVIGNNVPSSKISTAGFSIWSPSTLSMSGNSDFWDGYYANMISFGTEPTAHGPTHNPAITPEEAWNVDEKMDDGRPGNGSIRALKPTPAAMPNCATDGTSDATYALTTTSISCGLILIGAY